MSTTRAVLLAALSVLLAALLLACRPTPTPARLTEPGIGVEITGDGCPNIVVQAGQQVTWTNHDDDEHVVRATLEGGAGLFDSGTLTPGDTFAFTIPEPGRYPYACSADGTLTGTITVE